ncbi:hypothetical protein D0T49_06855 [Paludibacter sp. 221]|uniref:hypothetical protein n=1 Tax=Paludibacter sp. 221 TaxID=2302939 RepID=UPI0013D0EB9B|nr:hypothetical protein [Paludibacter sp. 221]NDV46763.1 hypothetical protein [Paludibacter sp. 221]
MMKKLLLFCVLLFNVIFVFSQRTLIIEDKSTDYSVFGGAGDEAGVIISAKEDIPLTFVFNYKPLEPLKIDTIASIVSYHFKFKAGAGNSRRLITINVKNYRAIELTVTLSPKQLKEFLVRDPSAETLDCFYQLTKEAEELFQRAMYAQAKDKYRLATECYDYREDSDIKQRIAVIDSLTHYKSIGDIFYNMGSYAESTNAYQRVLDYNRSDTYATGRFVDSRIKQQENCSNYYVTAENYYLEKDYEKAKELYTKILNMSCDKSLEASNRLIAMDNYMTKKRERARVLVYEYGHNFNVKGNHKENAPIGFSTGNYKEKRAGGYFSLHTNTDLFETIRSNVTETSRPELNVSFGWTIKIVKPVWIFLGPGYTAVGKFSEWEEGDDSKGLTFNDLKFNIHHAVSPEAGVLCKIGPVAVRYTFQYRFSFNYEQLDWVGKYKHYFGLGMCF